MSNLTQKCRHCEEVKPFTDFYMDRGRHETRCKSCSKEYSFGLRLMRKLATPKPYCCDACGETTEKLYIDHDRKNLKFRGWLCRTCNTGIGMAGDNIKGIMKQLNYLVERS